MSLIFDNELYDMTSTAKELLMQDDMPYSYAADVLFEEVPYYGHRTDIVTAQFDVWNTARRKQALGHLTPLPDERKYRHSYKKLQSIEPIDRDYWVHEDKTYHTEDTCRVVWDWFANHDYIRPLGKQEWGGLGGGWVTVKYPDILKINAWELKPRDWETALHQAMRADCYANHRWVLMDAGGIDTDDNEMLSEFRKANVGLATLSEDEVTVHIHPGRVTPMQTQTRILINERALHDIPGSVLSEVEEKYGELDGGNG